MFSSGKPSICKEDILKHIDEASILGYYLGINTIPTLINSPLREDKHPSFGLYCPKSGEVNYIDFSTGEKGTCWSLLERLWNVDREGVYLKVRNDLLKISKPISIRKVKITGVNDCKKVPTVLGCKVRNWEAYDIEYWNTYGISLDTLKKYEVYPISHKFITKDNKTNCFRADKYAYTFVERKEGKITHKFYQPFNKNGYKWQNNHDRSTLGLWAKLPEKGKKVVITSSVKDALCLIENLNIPCICLQGEGYPISDTAARELRRRFENIYILLDNDETGLKDAEKLANSTMFINVVIPAFEGGKDVSDYYKCFGKEKFIQLFESLIKEATYDYYNELPF